MNTIPLLNGRPCTLLGTPAYTQHEGRVKRHHEPCFTSNYAYNAELFYSDVNGNLQRSGVSWANTHVSTIADCLMQIQRKSQHVPDYYVRVCILEKATSRNIFFHQCPEVNVWRSGEGPCHV